MKSLYKSRFLILTFLGILTTVHLQGQESYVQDQEKFKEYKYLNVAVSYEIVKSSEKSSANEYNLVIRADGKSIKKMERIYIRIIDRKTNENVYVRAVNNEILERTVSITDESFKMVDLNKDQLRLNFGPFKKGDYDVFLKVKDDSGEKYFNRKQITL